MSRFVERFASDFVLLALVVMACGMVLTLVNPWFGLALLVAVFVALVVAVLV